MAAGVTVLSETICQLGEGPSYDPASDTLFWFDIVERKLLQKQMGGGDTTIHQLPVMASALGVVDEKRQLLVTENGLYLRDAASGTLTLHMPLEADNSITRSNDSRVHPCGAFWIGTMGKNAERHAGAIYWYYKGELRQLFPGITVSNSICFSPDGTIAYFTDTMKGLLFRIQCDPANGLPIGEPAIFYDHRGGVGGLDGSVVDVEGVLWNARWGAGCIDSYSPVGERLRTISVPAVQPTCPAFVGKNADRLAVTSAWQGMGEQARSADPQAGKTFFLDLAVKGRLEPNVAL